MLEHAKVSRELRGRLDNCMLFLPESGGQEVEEGLKAVAAKPEDEEPFPRRRVLQDGLHYSQCFLVSRLLLRPLKCLDCTLILTEGQTRQEEQELKVKETLEEVSPKPSNLREFWNDVAIKYQSVGIIL